MLLYTSYDLPAFKFSFYNIWEHGFELSNSCELGLILLLLHKIQKDQKSSENEGGNDKRRSESETKEDNYRKKAEKEGDLCLYNTSKMKNNRGV